MKQTAISAMLVLALGGCTAHMGPGSGAWQTLIEDGKGMDNFTRIGDANWRSEGGAVVADAGKGGYLVSRNRYVDFELRAEFYADTDTNSGVFIRCSDPSKLGADTCYEVNIWDIRPEPKYGTGAIVNVAAVPTPIENKAGGKWNVYQIVAKGPQLTVYLNGVQTVSIQDGKNASGYFGLQYGAGVKDARGGPIRWKKVEIRPL